MRIDTYPILKPGRNNNHNQWWLLIIVILLVAVTAGGLLSCTPRYTPEQAVNDVNKANIKQPAAVASYVRQLYPCITVATTTDSSQYHDWMADIDSLGVLYAAALSGLPDTAVVHDTTHLPGNCADLERLVWLKDDYIGQLTRQIHKPVTIHDTLRVEDKTLPIQLATLQTRNTTLQTHADQLQTDKDAWAHKAFVRFWWIVAMGAVLGVITGVQVKKFFTPKVKI